MTAPHFTVDLDNYYFNPSLQVQASALDQENWHTTVDIQKSVGYKVKISPDYTGYLEAEAGGKSVKWLWADKGLVSVGPSLLASLASGIYKARFRIWVPDTAYLHEKRLTDTAIPWSNEIQVNIL